MILLIDNYDSFTWNVYQAMAALGAEVEVHRNDALSVDQLLAMQPAAVVLSPGPGRPAQAGVCPELIARLPERTPLFGVCLGHQAIVEHYGGTIARDPEPTHGKASLVHHDGDRLFHGLSNPFPAGRYHSLRAERDRLPDALRLIAWTADGCVMAVRHVEHPRCGVQFHPESILTPHGERILANFLAMSAPPLSLQLTRDAAR